jgi:starch phosphorylase
LTIGTLDGANVEIMEAVGPENIFIFGLTAEQVTELRTRGYDHRRYYQEDEELRQALDMIASGYFLPHEPNLFEPIVRGLLDQGDYYMLLADYRPYITAQEKVSRLFLDQDDWARRSILNTAWMGKFSSDRSVLDYARNIWRVEPLV